MKIFVVKENIEIESRVAITPDIARKLANMGHELFIETSAGDLSQFFDTEYQSAKCCICKRNFLNKADIIFSVNSLNMEDIQNAKNEAIIISLQEPHRNIEKISAMRESNITSFALEYLPRTTRAQYMDVLSSQSSLAGYKAIIEAAHIFNRGFPMMITTAGTIPAAKVLVIGAGVAGLSAIATAKRLGAIVSAFDVRSIAKEQVLSLGAKFIEVEIDSKQNIDSVYAAETSIEYQKLQKQKLKDILPSQDIIITTAQIPFKPAPVIITKEMVGTMKNGAIIIDLASKTGGNCEQTKHGEIVETNGIKIIAFENILNLISYDASRLFAKNIFTFFELLTLNLQNTSKIDEIDDEIIKNTLLTFGMKNFKEELEK